MADSAWFLGITNRRSALSKSLKLEEYPDGHRINWMVRETENKEPGTFRASILEYSIEHLLSIALAASFHHNFVLRRRYQFPMWTKKRGRQESTYSFYVDVITALIIGRESV
jgi:hypothetical protein